MAESVLDREDRLDAADVGKMSDDDLVWFIERYLPSYEEPNSYFSGHNRMAELVREMLRRHAAGERQMSDEELVQAIRDRRGDEDADALQRELEGGELRAWFMRRAAEVWLRDHAEAK